MGRFVEGEWLTEQEWAEKSGEFVRKPSSFRERITQDGPFTPEAGRYLLYVSNACPWAHRALIVRKLKGLEAALPVVAVNPYMFEDGWTFAPGDGVDEDPILGARFLREIYKLADAHYTGRVTVPVLFDTKTRTIVNNESSEIIRDLSGPMSPLSATPEQAALDLYPEALRNIIDPINARVYATVNNGVYKCGFAGTQEAYNKAFDELFESLDWLEGLLGERRYLAGDTFTEADIRLFTTLVRFDAVYLTHFKCNRQRITEFEHLSGYLREIFQMPGIAATCVFEHIKEHYFGSHRSLNPKGIVPRGPTLDLGRPHGRGR
jgi:putative glutathione S-transferase